MRQPGCAEGEVRPVIVDDKAGKGASREFLFKLPQSSGIRSRTGKPARKILQAGIMAKHQEAAG